ncbi:hypothetical protein NQZ79_g3358 [Umbelopsis isabellina]|nr:hypothetical protein NQZ79_g3358 [Umbelopsis isabellina]
MPYISPKYRDNLSKYKYSGTDKSLLSRYVLTPYWNRLVKLFPLWVAPNLITMSGLLCVMTNLATLLYYRPDLGTCPNWVYYSFAAGLFIYQSLDAIDGKQARRTGSSGPLGELFDHGCDALNTTIEFLMVTSSLHFGQSWLTVAALAFSLGAFYLSTWEEYHTGTLYLSYFSGPVEGIIILVAIHTISGIFGPEFWLLKFSDLFGFLDDVAPLVGNLRLNEGFAVFAAFSLALNIVAGFHNVYMAASSQKRPVLPALLGFAPFVAACGIAYLWLQASPSIVHEHLLPFVLYIGASFGYQVGLIITAHLTKAPFPYFNLMLVPLAIGCINANLPNIIGIEPFFQGKKELPFLWSCFAFSILVYAHFAISVINELCDYFDIWCLTIKHKKAGDQTKKD